MQMFYLTSLALGQVDLEAYEIANMVHLGVWRRSRNLDHFMTKRSSSNASGNFVKQAMFVKYLYANQGYKIPPRTPTAFQSVLYTVSPTLLCYAGEGQVWPVKYITWMKHLILIIMHSFMLLSPARNHPYMLYFCFQFLITYGYGPSVSVKSLQTPSVKDFVKIFSFIYGLFCPSYELPSSKFEEEIPKIFKELG